MPDDGFRNRHERFNFLVAAETARRVLSDPTVLAFGTRHLATFAAADPRQREGYELWTSLLNDGPVAVATALPDRSSQGDFVRQTAPSFGALPAKLRAGLLRRARTPLSPPERQD